MRISALLSSLVLWCVTAVSPAYAQAPHTASQSTLDAVVQQHVSAAQADRETVIRLLDRPDIQALAAEIGLDLRHAQNAIRTLDGQHLADLASQARQVEQALAGGQSSITISTTMIIIGLLVLIVLILALK